MAATMTNPIVNDSLERKRRKERIVDKHESRDYVLCGKKVNRNVYELQRIYETTQMKSTKILPEFVERIRFMVVNEIKKATRQRYVDQNGELFNHVLEELMSKIVPRYDEKSKQFTTKYDPAKANLGTYIMRTCYWATRNWHNHEAWCEEMTCCGDFMEDYSQVAENPKDIELGELKFISSFDVSNTYVPLIQDLLQGARDE